MTIHKLVPALLVLLAAGCSRADVENLVSQPKGKPMAPKTDKGPVFGKHNFRTAEKDGYKVEVWMNGMTGLSNPIGAGYRVYLPEDAEVEPPEVVARLVLQKKEVKDVFLEATLQPILKKTAIEGGYWEIVQVDAETYVERKEKFSGMKGVWEIMLDDPLKTIDPKKGNIVPPDYYTLAIQIAVKNGPAFQFDNLPYRRIRSRDPFDSK